MPSANKDRIRVNLHVDREIYSLVKALSKQEGKPISRLFDEVFAPLVEKLRHTPEEWEEIQIERKIDKHEADQKRIESFSEMSESEIRDHQKRKLLEIQKEHEEFMKKWSEVLEGMQKK